MAEKYLGKFDLLLRLVQGRGGGGERGGGEEGNAPLSADSSEKSMLLIMKLRTYWSTEFACIFWPVSLTPPIDLIFPRNIFSHVCGLVCKFTAVRTHVIPLLKEREAARI